MKTVAEQLGQTPHLSPLLRRLRTLGLGEPEELRRLAVERGCWHYRLPGDEAKPVPSVRREDVSDVELALGLINAAQRFDPMLIRCAAQLLSGDGISAEEIARLAIMERAVPVVRHIARAGAAADEHNQGRWVRLLTLLPEGAEAPAGRLPHPSRFWLESGLTWRKGRLDRRGDRTWLRPRSPSK